jgi:hypothetical protein
MSRDFNEIASTATRLSDHHRHLLLKLAEIDFFVCFHSYNQQSWHRAFLHDPRLITARSPHTQSSGYRFFLAYQRESRPIPSRPTFTIPEHTKQAFACLDETT